MAGSSGICAKYPKVTLFCSSTQALVSAELSSSSQRYGSATFTPWYSSTTLVLRVTGYLIALPGTPLAGLSVRQPVRIKAPSPKLKAPGKLQGPNLEIQNRG